jgi:hypothetical protein
MENTVQEPAIFLADLLPILVPAEYLLNFELCGVKSKSDCWEIDLREKVVNVPTTLLGKEVVLDGFCNSISIMGHCFSLKRVYLVIYRRRWKERGSKVHHSNKYEFTAAGAKITKELADFLKTGY